MACACCPGSLPTAVKLTHPIKLQCQVLDMCADDDCDGCCTSNARKNGGFLIDLEAATAERFWEGDIQGLAAIQWQVV